MTHRLQTYCRTCQQDYTQEWRAKRDDKARYRAERKTAEGERKWQRKRVAKYGLTLEDYERMYAEQNGACFICETPHHVLCVDHCHATGKVRGLLCDPCNMGLGSFRDRQDRLLKAVEYLNGKG